MIVGGSTWVKTQTGDLVLIEQVQVERSWPWDVLLGYTPGGQQALLGYYPRTQLADILRLFEAHVARPGGQALEMPQAQCLARLGAGAQACRACQYGPDCGVTSVPEHPTPMEVLAAAVKAQKELQARTAELIAPISRPAEMPADPGPDDPAAARPVADGDVPRDPWTL